MVMNDLILKLGQHVFYNISGNVSYLGLIELKVKLAYI